MTHKHHQHESVLRQLRALVPRRSLTYAQAQRIVELQANHLRQLLNITGPELLEEEITGLPRLRVRRVVDLPTNVSGISHWHDGRWVIGLNALEPDTRQRFSLAHELWHIINHTTKHWLHPDTARFSSYQTGERLADHFAACLLMPKRHVKALIADGCDVTRLATTFDVSDRAMSVRLAALGLTDHVPDRHAQRHSHSTTSGRHYDRGNPDLPPCLEGAGT